MRLVLFAKTFILALVLALLYYALTPIALSTLLKAIALGIAVSIVVAVFYPDLRGIKSGDKVSVVSRSALPFFMGKIGRAISEAKKNNELRVRFGNGEEAVAIVESYEGLFSPPKVRILYEEKLSE